MGKVLKAVAVIAAAAAIAYFAPQISAAILASSASAATTAAVTAAVAATLTAAVAAGMSLLSSKPRTDATPSIFRQAISNSFIIYGKRRAGGLLIFFHPKGKDFRYFVIAVAGHRCKGVTRWYLGDDEVTVDGSGKVTSGTYANNAWLYFMRGTDDQQAHPTFVSETDGKWTAAHRGRGTALIYAKFKMVDEVVQAGMPNITAEIEGKDDILDPRTGARGYTRNAALVFYDWMALAREEGGFGTYPDEIDWDWVSAQANVSDEQVQTPGGPEARFAFDSYIQTGAAPSEVRDTFVTCCAGSFTFSGGKMLMRPGYYVPPSAQLQERDLAGPITVPALLAGDEIATEVSGSYVDPINLYQPRDVPTRSTNDSDVRQQSYDLPHITSPWAGQRLLEIYLRKSAAERRVTWPMNIMGLAISTLDTVTIATQRYGLSNYAFQVTSWGLASDFSVALQLEEHGPDIFEFNPETYLLVGQTGQLDRADPIETEPAALAQLIIATSYTVGAAISAADAGGSATATISDHSRVYQDRTVAVTGLTISGLTSSTTYFFYYDDAARAGGAVTIIATTDGAQAFPSSTAPARHYVGSVTTPAPGGNPSDGGGSSPPSGGEPIRYPEERLP
ncbi:phage tail protein [Sphingomonas sanguinis]|uniref:phage tail protein n=1 Tax=Sphingomonas sp. LC-1 TaxID=3110957 RepID=UPI0021BA4AFE|nr:phage tail protein [Sphingomonas sp. LC-1]MCT8003311.1 phage tail protein [Sphingomonas sp. LC-1]